MTTQIPKTTAEIRRSFLDYFQNQHHKIISSSSLVPENDPTLLFTNAGMVQFKDVFLGQDIRDYKRAVTIQRCVRAGGKHNDLENVGYTARHHTFFEMLGNFSFGDYFKREAIEYAWEFLTKILQLPPEKLWITVYEEDKDAADIWLNHIKCDPERFSYCGAKDNFWMMGDTGPCGPCTEIFYDHGPEIAGGPPGTPEQEGDRYVEIWNLVFMQYERTIDGKLHPIPKPSVDTGMGLERLAAVLQGVHNNYDIDIFRDLIQAAAKLTATTDLKNQSLRVLADHIRSTVFLVADGVMPSNEGRGYVLRRIIRRAIRHGHKLGVQDPFFYQLVAPLTEIYPEELSSYQYDIGQVLLNEEQQFAKTLGQGLRLLEQQMAVLTERTIPGEIIFQLYDTHGFPPDLTADIARERDFALDMTGFDAEMALQRQRSQQTSQFSSHLQTSHKTLFLGYETMDVPDCKIVDIIDNAIILDKTPFYAEGGGQVGDQGVLENSTFRFEVDTTKKYQDTYVHYGRLVFGKLITDIFVDAKVNIEKRKATMCNHTATHLLHAALRKILGTQVTQKGSLVDAERLRFDFSYSRPLTVEQIKEIEDLVNQIIRENIAGEIIESTLEIAQKMGALALFGEKYSDKNKVRVLKIGDFSVELCGGTHATATGEIENFCITNETGAAAGIRRIRAVTGAIAREWQRNREQQQLNKKIEKKLMSSKNTTDIDIENLIHQTITIQNIKILATTLEPTNIETLRKILDQLKQKLDSAVIVLATINENKITLIAGVTADLVKRFSAGELVSFVAKQVGGKGGGRADIAQGGGDQLEKLPEALDNVKKWIA